MTDEDVQKAQAQRLLEEFARQHAIASGQIWKHYKGFDCEIIALAVRQDDWQVVVVYRYFVGGQCWEHTIAQWTAERDFQNQRVKRFTRVSGKVDEYG